MASPKSARPRVAIVGTGLSGLSMAIALKKQLKSESFTIYERANSVGGTWRDTTYPGCGSDVGGHWYSLSTEINPDWSSYFVEQPEIEAYWDKLFHKYHLELNTEFGTEVSTAEWSDSSQVWVLHLRNMSTGEQRQVEAEVLVWATGPFSRPAIPKIPGLDTFPGEVWHSSKWRHDVPLAGKRIAVIGNGCSAAQLIPKISDDPTVEVLEFARSKQWYVPRPQFKYPGWEKWMFRNVPFAARLYRNFLMAQSDLPRFLVFANPGSWLERRIRKLLKQYVDAAAPADLAHKLVPDFSPGCRRVIADPGYLEALKRPNVTLVQDDIESVSASGVKPLSATAPIPVDHIVLATGYDMGFRDWAIKGRDGVWLQEWYDSQGGPTAYLGSFSPGFPNFIFLVGPNTATGHASVVFTVEVQIQYALKLIKHILAGRVQSFDVQADVCEEWNRRLQAKLQRSVWQSCRSYYRTGGTGKIFATWPGTVTQFWWANRTVKWGDFRVVEARRGALKRRLWLERVRRWGLGALAAGLVALGMDSRARDIMKEMVLRVEYAVKW